MSKKLNEDLMQSELSGSAFFQPVASPVINPPTDEARQPEVETQPQPVDALATPPPAKIAPVQPAKRDTVTPRNHETSQASDIAILQYSNIAITQDDIRKLKQVGYKAQSFRFTDEEIDRLKDLAYSLSKVTRRKVTQADLLRIGLLLLEKSIHEDQAQLVNVLQAI